MNKRAKLIEQYAKDWSENDRPWELWETDRVAADGVWNTLMGHPAWSDKCNYRRKKQTININGYEVPEPERVQPEIGVEYFTPMAGYGDIEKHKWEGDGVDIKWLNQGVVHLTSDAAKLHLKALLSFTDGTGTKVHSNASRTSFFGSAVDLSEMLRSDAIEKSKYFDIAELHMKVLVGNILKGLDKNG